LRLSKSRHADRGGSRQQGKATNSRNDYAAVSQLDKASARLCDREPLAEPLRYANIPERTKNVRAFA
jgi:hypothetical protein